MCGVRPLPHQLKGSGGEWHDGRGKGLLDGRGDRVSHVHSCHQRFHVTVGDRSPPRDTVSWGGGAGCVREGLGGRSAERGIGDQEVCCST